MTNRTKNAFKEENTMCKKEYEIRQEIKELENRKSELVRKEVSYINSRDMFKNLYGATDDIYLMDIIQKYIHASIDINRQIQKLNDSLLDKYKELKRIIKCNNGMERCDDSFFYEMDMFDIRNHLERDGFINGIKF